MRNLNHDILIELGYIKEIQEDYDGEEYTTWYKNGIMLFEDSWSTTPNFSFASRTREDGSFKSGWSIKTDEQLQLLEKALTGETYK